MQKAVAEQKKELQHGNCGDDMEIDVSGMTQCNHVSDSAKQSHTYQSHKAPVLVRPQRAAHFIGRRWSFRHFHRRNGNLSGDAYFGDARNVSEQDLSSLIEKTSQ